MANKSTAAYLDEILNYAGRIFTASQIELPVLSMLGGLNNNSFALIDNVEFNQGVLYAHETVAQTTKTEHETLSAPTALSFERTNQKDVIELKLQMAHVTALRQSISGRLQTPTTKQGDFPPPSEIDWQVQKHIEQMAREYNYGITQGTYVAWSNKSTATQQRGLIEQASDASNTVAAGSVDLSVDLINELIRTMADNGAIFQRPVFIVNMFQKQKISEIYGLQPRDYNVGGVNINYVNTDAGEIGVVYDRMQPAATLTLAEMSVLQPVAIAYQGTVIYVDSRDPGGVGEKEIIYAQIGCDKGPNWMHGTITGLTTS